MLKFPALLACAAIACTAPLFAEERDDAADVSEKTLAAIAALDQRGATIANLYLKDRVAGAPVSCIPQTRLRRSSAASDNVLLYDAGSVVYVNSPYLGCPRARDNAMISSSPVPRLCAGDIILVQDMLARAPLGSCALNKFVPFRKVKRPK
ncbi:hypothetical protein GCM10010833_15480 [Blastomonas aquatica]|uniref:Uncharacterized protein n=2 Tax=Blastomonas aquatica TaxID=1510276 RepID=A0ABQ1J8S1_9SPHN|nr:hypothetical protein GCM10010833_15480 [Blastomonas aquatica]